VASDAHPNWLLARAELAAIVGSDCGFDLDSLPGVTPAMWRDCVFSGRTEVDRWHELCSAVGFSPRSGPLVVVPVTSEGSFGPFFTRTELLPEFFQQHAEVTGNCVLSSGDLVVVVVEEATAIIYHHSELALLLGGGDQS